jgi:hypothetical protein
MVRKRKKTQPKNKELVQQLISDSQAECYRFCDVSVTISKGGVRYFLNGPIERIDLRKERIYIKKSQDIEGVPLSEIVDYKWNI